MSDQSISVKEYVDALFVHVIRYIEVLDKKNERYNDAIDEKNQAALRAALASEQLARTVALVEIKAGQSFHNDLIRKGERDRAETTAQMITKVEFRPVADFVERSRQNSITTGKFIGYLFAVAGLAMTLGFGLASYLATARTQAIAAAQTRSSSGSPEVVIPLPPAVPREPRN